MKVQVLFFGATAEATGKREIEIDAEDGLKADVVFGRVIANFPQLQKHSLLFALNQEYSKGSETIKDGDELAVFTHVSGG
jgi:molybdopterin converting factor small subunit